MYRIIEWEDRYEVNDRGSSVSPGTSKRKGKLTFIKLKVHGHSQGKGWRRLLRETDRDDALMVFGLFCKLLEMAGDYTGDERDGMFSGEREDDDSPSFILDVPSEQVKYGLDILVRLGWIEAVSPGTPGTPDGPGKLGSSQVKSRQVKSRQDKTRQVKTTDTETGTGKYKKTLSARLTGNGSERPAGASVAESPRQPGPDPDGKLCEAPLLVSPDGPPEKSGPDPEPQTTTPTAPSASKWQLAREEVKAAFGHDAGITKAMSAIAGSVCLSDSARTDEVAEQISQLVTDAKSKGDRPKAYFMGAMQKRFRCVGG